MKMMMRVLVADDDPVTRNILEKAISKWGFTVLVAENGNDAWNVLRRKRVSLAVLDWMMSGMSGVDICRSARVKMKSRYVYLILLTARDRRQDLVEGLSAGADDYMTKPVNLAELKARLQTGVRVLRLEQDLRKAKRTLQKMAYFDALTALWNRRKILDFLKEELARGQRDNYPTSLILLDVDHFKKINDRFGHIVGDRVLVEMARRIRKAVRVYDRIGRYGGDELLVIVYNCGQAEARLVAERIRAAIGDHLFKIARRALEVTVSLGVVTTGKHLELSASQMLHFSDQALYQAKRHGRNATVIHPGTGRKSP